MANDKLIVAGKTYDVVMQTNCGTFTIRLDQAQSPNATGSRTRFGSCRIIRAHDVEDRGNRGALRASV